MRDWTSGSDPVEVLAVLEAICSDAALDGFSDMTTGRLVAVTGVRAETVERIIWELVGRGLVHLRHVPRNARRILELGVELRLVYRLVA
jgi:hypothetical protein